MFQIIQGKSSDEWRRIFEDLKAFWVHDGNPKRPHALLTGGKHSGGFFNGSLVIEKPRLLMEACADLLEKSAVLALGRRPKGEENIPPYLKVFGSANGATDISFAFGYLLDCKRGFTEKATDLLGKEHMEVRRFGISPWDIVVLVEDVITSGETIRQSIRAIEMEGVWDLSIWDEIFALVNRSGMRTLDGRRIVSLVDVHMPTWTPEDEECPLCMAGSHAIPPKGNWDALMRAY